LPFCCFALKAKKPLPYQQHARLWSIAYHLRKRRFELGLLQQEVGQRIHTTECCVYLWERGKAIPTFPYWPKIIEFLGYSPYDPDWTPGERLTWIRKYLGLSQEAMARRLRVDPGTLARWERGEREPRGRFLVRLVKFLGGGA
jgi:transcriptional regulator with XRE-family HTH domain